MEMNPPWIIACSIVMQQMVVGFWANPTYTQVLLDT
jgi:hypothetical protein